jgi:hypothetical protein
MQLEEQSPISSIFKPVNNTRDNLKGVADLIQRVADCERFRFTNHTCAEADDANIAFVC